jgi:two-component system OmpR family sensor kinase
LPQTQFKDYMTEALQPGYDSSGSDKDRLIEELREAVRARDEFVAIAAHELRNPMTPILVQVDMLMRTARDPGRCRPDIIAPRLERLQHAVNEFIRRSTILLDVSRIAAGNLQIERSQFDLCHVVREVVDRVKPTAHMARSTVETDLQENVIGTWDRLAVEQIVENLLSNALKFGAGRPVTVTLLSDNQTVQLVIRDRGIGISEEACARIFQRFERAVAHSEHGGFGVGLWLANQLVVAMGGTIGVESIPGEGATFLVRLPMVTAGAVI